MISLCLKNTYLLLYITKFVYVCECVCVCVCVCMCVHALGGVQETYII